MKVFAEISQNEAYSRAAERQAMASGMSKEEARRTVRGNANRRQRKSSTANYRKKLERTTGYKQNRSNTRYEFFT